ncbi:phosphotransferase [uncultured Shewanella sp.]|uniref:phosphotransferase n=1 Tax=uncultured Shewanella sp. TaxID=173975 RepID=UPI0026141AF7|nr:phosphotransferase [uncultured Shewanella sp.]
MSICPLMSALHTELKTVELTSVSLIAALSQGLSNHNYYIRGQRQGSDNEQWVLRVNSQASSQLCNRANEVANWTLAAHQGLAPALEVVATDFSCYLSEFIEQDSLDWATMASAQGPHPLKIEQVHHADADTLLLSLLNSLQSLPLPKNVMSMTAQWQDYYDVLNTMSKSLNQGQAQFLTVFKAHFSAQSHKWQSAFEGLMKNKSLINEWLQQVEACLINNQFCHRDLNPHNLLLNQGQLFAIDYEYACASHPLWDLAGVLATHNLSSIQRHNLILGYLQDHPNLTQDAFQAVPSSIHLYWVYSACWALMMAFSFLKEGQKVVQESRNSDEYVAKVDEYLNYFEQFIQYSSS